MPSSAAGYCRKTRTAVLPIMVGLSLVACLPYFAGGVSPAFIGMDDQVYVLENPRVQAGLTAAAVRWALTSFDATNWHPLTWISHMADVSLFGLEARGHHLTSILLHMVTTALLFLALYRLTGARWPSALSAAVFGVHPLRVESVAWVAERKDVLSGLIFMLVLLAYERYARRGGTGRALVVALMLALGLMAKPMLVTVPAVLLLLDFWPLGRARWGRAAGGAAPRPAGWPGLIVEKLPLLALAATSSVLTVLAQRSGGAIADLLNVSFKVRLGNAVVSAAAYLGKMIWPTALAVYYPHPRNALPGWRIVCAAGLLIAVTVAVFSKLRQRPFLAVGWLWFLGMLLPVIGLVQVGQQAMADRYTYLPTIGLLIGAAWTAANLRSLGRWRAAALGIGSGVILVALTVTATAQARRWKDSETLFRYTLAVTADNWVISSNLGNHLWENGRFNEALPLYRDALRINPALGTALYRIGQPKAAEAQYRRDLQLRPDDPETMNNLGNILDERGQAEEAIELFRRVLRLKPGYHLALNNLGASLESQGRTEEALALYRQALRSRPDYPEALYNLGNVLARSGRREEAIANLRELLRQHPDHAPAQRRLEALLAGSR